MPNFIINLGTYFHISTSAIVYGTGVVELLVGISLASNMFVDFFALVAAVLLITISLFYGFNEVLVRDVGLIGALLALVFWPHPRYR